ncbi:Cytochrome P450 1A1 [Plecturocebus cupreus]
MRMLISSCQMRRSLMSLLDLFGAGFDTVTTAISWSLMYLVTNPRVQRKIQEELGEAPWSHCCLTLALLQPTYLIRATCLSSILWDWGSTPWTLLSPSLPLQLPPSAYRKLWVNPSEFLPERFLTPDGGINKVLSEKVILFGMGKWKCIGETIARWEVFLFLAILLQQVEFSMPPGVKVDVIPIYGLTMKHTCCEHFQMQLRS